MRTRLSVYVNHSYTCCENIPEITLKEAALVTGAVLYQYNVANSLDHSSSNDLLFWSPFFHPCMLKACRWEQKDASEWKGEHWNIVMQCSKQGANRQSEWVVSNIAVEGNALKKITARQERLPEHSE